MYAEERDCGNHGKRCPRVDTQDSGVGKRVAGERLHEGPGNAESCANNDDHPGSGYSLLGNHHIGFMVAQPLHGQEYVAGGDRFRPIQH